MDIYVTYGYSHHCRKCRQNFFLLSMPGINEILIPWPIGLLGEKSQ